MIFNPGIRGSPVSHSNAANMSLNEINSPLRMLTLTNSPATPLSALMQSPQFAQKVRYMSSVLPIKCRCPLPMVPPLCLAFPVPLIIFFGFTVVI